MFNETGNNDISSSGNNELPLYDNNVINHNTNSTRYLYNKLIICSIVFCSYATCISLMLYLYSSSWANTCDIEAKIWSLGWATIGILKTILRLGSLANRLYKIRNNIELNNHQNLWQHPLIELTTFCWFIYGMFVCFSGNTTTYTCNKISNFWCLFGWSQLAFVYFHPCLILILVAPIVLLFVRVPFIRQRLIPYLFGSTHDNNDQVPIPKKQLDKLIPHTYSYLLENNLIDIQDNTSDNLTQPQPNNSAQPPKQLGSTLAGGITSVINKINSKATNIGNNLARNTLNNTREILNQKKISSICPICVSEYEQTDMITQLPCNPRLHYFHETCIISWFNKSSNCPMCRTNITKILENLP